MTLRRLQAAPADEAQSLQWAGLPAGHGAGGGCQRGPGPADRGGVGAPAHQHVCGRLPCRGAAGPLQAGCLARAHLGLPGGRPAILVLYHLCNVHLAVALISQVFLMVRGCEVEVPYSSSPSEVQLVGVLCQYGALFHVSFRGAGVVVCCACAASSIQFSLRGAVCGAACRFGSSCRSPLPAFSLPRASWRC